jgi:plasmid maintenance system antidote protein VapI
MLLTSAGKAEVAQEVVAAAFAGALRTHGGQKDFARAAGVAPVFVNHVVRHKRMLSVRMARRLAPLLPLSRQDQISWLGHVELY